jgi:mRNA-degrading endonuclease toxin of MazEF toxin-antitoxin module
MDQGDIYLVSLEPTSGHEQRGARVVGLFEADDRR